MKYLVMVLGVMVGTTVLAEVTEEALSDQLAELDKTFFQRGFNQCDLDYLKSHVSEELRFYHDQSGVQDTAKFLHNTKKYICREGDTKPVRFLVPGSLQTFPLYNDGRLYGAIQQGKHVFYLRQAGQPDKQTSSADFASTWTRNGDDWQLENVLSYNHTSPGAEEEALLETLNSAGVPALAIGILMEGRIQSTRVYGKLDDNRPAPQNALFKVASLTKPIVTLLTLKLAHAGRLDLDEPLSKYWVDPDLVSDNRVHLLTPRIVLTHQTGFPNWRWMSDDKKLSFNFAPGQGHGYSGEGFEYLRQALENKFDIPLEKLAEEYVFIPAGMEDTHFWWDEAVDEGRYAQHYDAQGKQLPLHKYYKANGAANLITTIGDYSSFMQYVINQRHLMPVLYGEMTGKQLQLGEHHYFGLGWEIFDNFSTQDRAVMHTGRDPGVNTLAVFFPESENAYVIFMNGDNSIPVLEHILPRLYLGSQLWSRR
ncbi:serine hydrolase [Bowmanella dokdonensis]|uniref:Class A beta-lactamase-related serine hydrolase n=1 Tax=Bowmanella dokdonensis TaxID=751969 RepID=A0A939DP21_9ALTE|nr:serine hydrolase [Bowmanella dokdonensis]MBN7825311.1 class A beta-lactamase-related serine hydrolase [Bowmanella dokdonensis]